MRLIGRSMLFIALLIMGGLSLTAFGGVTPRYVLAPATLILVLGMTLVLGWLSYDAKRLAEEFKKIFTSGKHENSDESRKLLMQLAAYSLISGIILATVQVLVQIWDRDNELLMLGTSAVSLRMPLTSVLYSVLTAMGFWTTSCRAGVEDQPASNKKHYPNLAQVGLFSCLLVLTAGVLALLLLGMSLDQRAQAQPSFTEVDSVNKAAFVNEMATVKSGQPIEPLQVLHEEVEGLYQGKDMIWRPKSVRNKSDSSDTVSSGTGQKILIEKSKTLSDVILSSTDLPLRWELGGDVNSAVYSPPGQGLTYPAVNQGQ
ncbi:MAG: hypothetical protein JXD22_13885 [Sedimentisphaerales bacterium]|nr:hypothetical protein [Sedimentisphaerales bacterium]